MRMITASVQIFLWHLSTLSGQVTRSSKPLRLIVSAGLLHPNTLLMSRSTNNYMSHLLPRERQWWWQYCEYDETHFSWKYDKGRQLESHASCWPDPKSLSLGLSNRYASAPHWSCYSTLLSGDIKWRSPAVDWHLLQMCSPHPVTLPRKSLLSDRSMRLKQDFCVEFFVVANTSTWNLRQNWLLLPVTASASSGFPPLTSRDTISDIFRGTRRQKTQYGCHQAVVVRTMRPLGCDNGKWYRGRGNSKLIKNRQAPKRALKTASYFTFIVLYVWGLVCCCMYYNGPDWLSLGNVL